MIGEGSPTWAYITTLFVSINQPCSINVFSEQNKKEEQNLLKKDVIGASQNFVAAYDCKIVEGVLSHQMKQFVIDGD